MGLVQYSKNAVSDFQFGDYIRNATGIKEAISGMRLLTGTTHTYSAIEYVLDHELTETAGRRENVPLALLLLTDGRIKVGVY